MSVSTDGIAGKTPVLSRGSAEFLRADMPRAGKLWWAVLLCAISAGLFGMRYSLPHPPGFLREVKNHVLLPHVVQIHAILASLALMAGPWQFLPSLRARYPRVHRWVGRIYVADVLAAVIVGCLLMPTVTTGFPAASGLAVAGVLWLGFAILGILAIRRHDIQTHRRWMLRSYAIPFASVTIKLYFIPMKALGVPFQFNYPASIWLSILTNLVIIESCLRWPQLRAAVAGWRDNKSAGTVDALPSALTASGTSGTQGQ